MLPDQVSNPGSLTYESDALPIALRGPAGDSNGYTLYTIFNIKKKITLNYPKYAVTGFSKELQNELKQPW